MKRIKKVVSIFAVIALMGFMFYHLPYYRFYSPSETHSYSFYRHPPIAYPFPFDLPTHHCPPASPWLP